MKYRNLLIIGTSHIAKQSLDEVKKAIEEERPDIIALELDARRYKALTEESKAKIGFRDIRKIGVKGFLFYLLGSFAEKKLGEQVGISPGSEMKQAIRLAIKNNINIAFIDQDIGITLKRLSSITWKEKWHFLVDVVRAVIFRKPEVEFDLKKVPSQKIIEKMIRKVKQRYPNLYKVLVAERNSVMAKNLFWLMKNNQDKKILAVVGAGHEKDIVGILKNYQA